MVFYKLIILFSIFAFGCSCKKSPQKDFVDKSIDIGTMICTTNNFTQDVVEKCNTYRSKAIVASGLIDIKNGWSDNNLCEAWMYTIAIHELIQTNWTNFGSGTVLKNTFSNIIKNGNTYVKCPLIIEN